MLMELSALELDAEAELVGGAFSRDPDKSRASAAGLHLDQQRVYHDYRSMAQQEAHELAQPHKIRFHRNRL